MNPSSTSALSARTQDEFQRLSERTLRRKDVANGTLLAVAMAIVFTSVGGKPLAVTFLPGVVVSWCVYVAIAARRTELPRSDTFGTIYLATLAWQFLHFAEEYVTRFYESFPRLYGRDAFSPELFVSFNMASYFIFLVAWILAFAHNMKFFAVPVLFFIVYGAIGNAISHTWWTLSQGSYFPGFWTAQLYWILGPMALTRLTGSRRITMLTMISFAIILISLLLLFRTTSRHLALDGL